MANSSSSFALTEPTWWPYLFTKGVKRLKRETQNTFTQSPSSSRLWMTKLKSLDKWQKCNFYSFVLDNWRLSLPCNGKVAGQLVRNKLKGGRGLPGDLTPSEIISLIHCSHVCKRLLQFLMTASFLKERRKRRLECSINKIWVKLLTPGAEVLVLYCLWSCRLSRT